MGEYVLIAMILVFAVGIGIIVKMAIDHADETLAELDKRAADKANGKGQ